MMFPSTQGAKRDMSVNSMLLRLNPKLKPYFVHTVLSLLFILLTNQLYAHPAHVSWAEMQLNQDECKLEVSLSAADSKPVKLNDTVDTQPRLKRLLDRFFLLKTRASDEGQLQTIWVGYEYTHKALWIHFEVPLNPEDSQVWLNNKLLLAQLPRQVNTVVYKKSPDPVSYSFSAEAGQPAVLQYACP